MEGKGAFKRERDFICMLIWKQKKHNCVLEEISQWRGKSDAVRESIECPWEDGRDDLWYKWPDLGYTQFVCSDREGRCPSLRTCAVGQVAVWL